MKLYAYTMTFDTGFAPCVYTTGGKKILTLACCKSGLRHKIGKEFGSDEDIYIMGLCGKTLRKRYKYLTAEQEYVPIYIAKIQPGICVKEYYSGEFFSNRPDQRYLIKDGIWYSRKNNPHQEKKDLKYKNGLAKIDQNINDDLIYKPQKNSEIQSNYVLPSQEYVYFGKEIMPFTQLPKIINKIADIRRKAPRGHLVELSDGEQAEFIKFFNTVKEKDINAEAIPLDSYFMDKLCKGAC